MVARRAHNPKVVGSNPAPATRKKKPHFGVFYFMALGRQTLGVMVNTGFLQGAFGLFFFGRK